jgi:WD40 repeat protein
VTQRAAWPRGDFAFSPDGRLLAAPTRDDGAAVGIFDLASEHELVRCRGTAGVVGAVAFSPDGRRLATAAAQGKGDAPCVVTVWDVSTGQEVQRFPPVAVAVRALAFDPAGRTLVAGGHDQDTGTVFVWDIPSGQPLHRLTGARSALSLAFQPGGTELAAADLRGNAVHAWDLATGQTRYTLSGVEACSGVTYSPDGRRLAAVGYRGDVHLVDPASGEPLLRLRTFAPPAGTAGFTPRVAFSPDGARIAANSVQGVISIWSAGPRRPGP